jgi:TM2 domain-containing membrane protein YozV
VFSGKSWITALLLSILVGGFGVDRFYLGYTGLGLLKLLTLGGCGIWSIIDIIQIATRKLNDGKGMPLGE